MKSKKKARTGNLSGEGAIFPPAQEGAKNNNIFVSILKYHKSRKNQPFGRQKMLFFIKKAANPGIRRPDEGEWQREMEKMPMRGKTGIAKQGMRSYCMEVLSVLRQS
ncbi:MAG: hypothetical protein MR051_07130 [Lentisphaeria bacterium]|nr:hypothetical protein [Lentisphaeria bacterium]